MIKKLKRLEYLLEQINDEELKLLIIDTFMGVLEDLPEEIIDAIREELIRCDEDNSLQSLFSSLEVP